MGLYVRQLVALLNVYGYDHMLHLWIEGPHPMKMVNIEDEDLEFLLEAQKSLQGLGKYDTLSSVIRELCMVYFWRGE